MSAAQRVHVCVECGQSRRRKARGMCVRCYSRFLRAQTGPVVRVITPAVDRFWAKVDKSSGPTGCWLWTAYVNRGGYGNFTPETYPPRVPIGAHQFSYELAHGPVPSGLVLDHICRVRSCVNPLHLRPVTTRENVLIGIGPSALNAQKVECPRGHAYNDENTRVWNGKRSCLICHRINQANYLARKRAS